MKRLALFLLAFLLVVSIQASKQIPVTVDTTVLTTADSKDVAQKTKDSLLLQKLSPDQLVQLEEQRLDLERQRIKAENGSDLSMSSSAIVLICLLPFLFVGVVFFLNVRHKNEESKRRYDLYTKSLEMGQAVPEHFFDEPKVNPISNLKRGILFLAAGLSIIVSFLVMNQIDGLIVGIVPSFIGIGYLVVHFLEKPKSDIADKSDEQR